MNTAFVLKSFKNRGGPPYVIVASKIAVEIKLVHKFLRRKMCDSATQTRTFFGLDMSTQQLKGCIVNDRLELVQQAAVEYDSALPEFQTRGGILIDKDNPDVITSPTLMFVKALDVLMHNFDKSGVDFSKIAAISGSGQQHGSVYWKDSSDNILHKLDPGDLLHRQLADCFSVENSPIWMDSSTTKQCKELEDAIGGPYELAKITGSRAYERFTGSQIAKIYQTRPKDYQETERISLISSFLCTLFLGDYAQIDIADGSGMNLMDIHQKQWNKTLLDTAAPNLANKLGTPVPSHTNLGPVSNYFVQRYGFNPECRVIACTGDNPSSLIGMRLNEGWLAVSLGTSDTVFLWIKEPKVVLNGHILCNPVDPNAYMAMLCFKNGSLTRERFRDKFAGGVWKTFNELLQKTPRGNSGHLGMFYDAQEILPFLHGDHRYIELHKKVVKFDSPEIEIRAVIEGQFIARRAYAEDIGFNLGRDTKILATGGASANANILQVLADVFNCPVYVQTAANSAMLGGAYNAKLGLLATDGPVCYTEVTEFVEKPTLLCEPATDAGEIYDPMVAHYRQIVASLTGK